MKARHAAEEKIARDRRSKLEKLVQYGMALVDMGALSEPQPATEITAATVSAPAKPKTKTRKRHARGPRRGGKTWTATIKRIVTKSGRGMTYAEVKAELKNTHLASTLIRTDKAFYTSIGKLSERGDIVKYHGRVYAPKVYQQFMKDVAAGRVIDEPATFMTGIESPNEIAIERFLKARPGGATTSEIVGSLLNDPPADLNVTKNRNSIYNLLKRQIDNGKLIRRGDRYYLPVPKAEAPGSEEPSAPDHKGDENGNPSLSGNGRLVPSLAFPDAIPGQPGE